MQKHDLSLSTYYRSSELNYRVHINTSWSKPHQVKKNIEKKTVIVYFWLKSMSLGFNSNVIRGQLYKRAKTRRFSQSSKSTNEEECRLSAKPEASFAQ